MKVRVLKREEVKWFYIETKNSTATGYMPGIDAEDACEAFGCKLAQCKVKEVIRTENGFEWYKNCEQQRLL